MDLQLLVNRLTRCLLLDARSFEEVRRDPAETLSSVLIVIVASYIAGLGGLIWTYTAASSANHLHFFIHSFLVGSAIQAAVFLLWVTVSALVLQRIFLVRATWSELLRVMGFGFVPIALQLIVFVPALDQPFGIIALAMTFFVTTYAIQVTTSATAGQAFVACLAGFAVFCIILGALGNGASDFAPGIFALDPNSLSVALTYPVLPVRR